jgi:hypothetical protein
MFDAIRRAVTIHVGSGGSRASFEALVRALEVNFISPHVGEIFPSSELQGAMLALERGGHFGKLVLSYD